MGNRIYIIVIYPKIEIEKVWDLDFDPDSDTDTDFDFDFDKAIYMRSP